MTENESSLLGESPGKISCLASSLCSDSACRYRESDKKKTARNSLIIFIKVRNRRTDVLLCASSLRENEKLFRLKSAGYIRALRHVFLIKLQGKESFFFSGVPLCTCDVIN